MEKVTVTAVILAGGIGSRMCSDVTKQRMILCGKSILQRTACAFFNADSIDNIVFVVRSDEIDFTNMEISQIASKPYKIVVGGSTRSESSENGVRAVGTDGFVAIHDAARCLITPKMINTVVDSAIKNGAATAVCKINDTLKRIENGKIVETIPRENVVRAQTPQVFKISDYLKAIETCMPMNTEFTDDNMLIERLGIPITCVDLGAENIKITEKEDLFAAEQIIKHGGHEYV